MTTHYAAIDDIGSGTVYGIGATPEDAIREHLAIAEQAESAAETEGRY